MSTNTYIFEINKIPCHEVIDLQTVVLLILLNFLVVCAENCPAPKTVRVR